MFREQPDMREPSYAIRTSLPASLVSELNRRAEARASIAQTISQARDALMAELLAAALTHRATGCTTSSTPQGS